MQCKEDKAKVKAGNKKRYSMVIVERLHLHKDYIPQISCWHFEQWGPLTGAQSLAEYAGILHEGAVRDSLPLVFVALAEGMLVGSATLLQCDMTIRKNLHPWLGQLFVVPERRKKGIGSTLVRSIATEARKLGFGQVYLYTSGTLPFFYQRLGWSLFERVDYLGKERSVMHYELEGNDALDKG